MKSRHIALAAAVAAASTWTAKAVAIGVSGGLDKSPLEGPLFFVGLVFFVVTVVALGIAGTAGAHLWLRIVAGVSAFVAGIAATLIVDAIVAALASSAPDRHWVWTELNLWVVALVALAVAGALNRPHPPRTTLA
jgi:hypothetical protein